MQAVVAKRERRRAPDEVAQPMEGEVVLERPLIGDEGLDALARGLLPAFFSPLLQAHRREIRLNAPLSVRGCSRSGMGSPSLSLPTIHGAMSGITSKSIDAQRPQY